MREFVSICEIRVLSKLDKILAMKDSSTKEKVIIIGSGPIRIGQGIEFDYASVHCTRAVREMGYEAIVINNNPETVSTDFDISDRLYFEPLTTEDVLNIIDREQPLGVVVQFGGQTAINLAKPLTDAGVRILGSQYDSIDLAEDRERFDQLLVELGIPKPAGRAVVSADAAVEVANEIGYPVLVRPSYVLGGRAMEIVFNERDLRRYMKNAVDVSPEKPILVDKYITGKEAEVDVISDGARLFAARHHGAHRARGRAFGRFDGGLSAAIAFANRD